MTDLERLLRRLPDDPRPVAHVNAELEAAIDIALARHAMPWVDHYRLYLTPALFLRHDPAAQRRAFEIHAWRIGYLLGLDAARCPSAVQLDLSRPLRLHQAVLVWCRWTLESTPWDDFDLRPLRSFMRPQADPIARALWRLATGSGVPRLREAHRHCLEEVRRRPLGFAALAVEEAREIAAEMDDVQALRQVIELLHDPVSILRHPDEALAVLGQAQLYRAQAHHRLGSPSAAIEALDRWRGIYEAVEVPDEQKLPAAALKARLEMDRGELDAAGDRLARAVFKLADGPGVSNERRVEVFAAVAEQHARCGRLDDAAGLLQTALPWIGNRRGETEARLHIDVVEHLARLRWHTFANAVMPSLLGDASLPDSLFSIVEQHRDAFRHLRRALDAVAADVLRDGTRLLSYRQWAARALVIDEPHDAVEQLAAVAIDLRQRGEHEALLDLIRDLMAAQRLAGWRRDQLHSSQPIAAVTAGSPDLAAHVGAMLDGKDSPLGTSVHRTGVLLRPSKETVH